MFDKDQNGYISASEVNVISYYCIMMVFLLLCLEYKIKFRIVLSINQWFIGHVLPAHIVEECDDQPWGEDNR